MLKVFLFLLVRPYFLMLNAQSLRDLFLDRTVACQDPRSNQCLWSYINQLMYTLLDLISDGIG
jgi:hypothetical protein